MRIAAPDRAGFAGDPSGPAVACPGPVVSVAPPFRAFVGNMCFTSQNAIGILQMFRVLRTLGVLRALGVSSYVACR